MWVLESGPAAAALFPVQGYRALALRAGLKPSGLLDLGLLFSLQPCKAAGVFTQNRFRAAPVLVSQQRLKTSASNVRAVIVNSGQANACTGSLGLQNAQKMVDSVEKNLGNAGSALVMSTGIIGHHLDMGKIEQGIQKLCASALDEEVKNQWTEFADSICTTDTRRKTAFACKDGVTIAGVAKGAGMIHPNMATMLSVIFTDQAVSEECLSIALKNVADQTYNAIDIDGDTSTNDTVLLLANGAAKQSVSSKIIKDSKSKEFAEFEEGLYQVAKSLSTQIVKDGEGVTRFMTIHVRGAKSNEEARLAAKAISKSSLVKCAIHGGDPNWGRILCAAGYSGASFSPEDVNLRIGDVWIVRKGEPVVLSDSETKEAQKAVAADEVDIEVVLSNSGKGIATVWSCDLSEEYVTFNSAYTT